MAHPEDAVGRPATVIFPEDRQDEEPGILSRILRGERASTNTKLGGGARMAAWSISRLRSRRCAAAQVPSLARPKSRATLPNARRPGAGSRRASNICEICWLRFRWRCTRPTRRAGSLSSTRQPFNSPDESRRSAATRYTRCRHVWIQLPVRSHRLFSFISINWRGKPLRSFRTIVELIAATTTETGLTVRAELDEKKCP